MSTAKHCCPCVLDGMRQNSEDHSFTCRPCVLAAAGSSRFRRFNLSLGKADVSGSWRTWEVTTANSLRGLPHGTSDEPPVGHVQGGREEGEASEQRLSPTRSWRPGHQGCVPVSLQDGGWRQPGLSHHHHWLHAPHPVLHNRHLQKHFTNIISLILSTLSTAEFNTYSQRLL